MIERMGEKTGKKIFYVLTAVVFLTSICFHGSVFGDEEKKAESPEKGRLVARIGERKIYESEMNEMIEKLPEERREMTKRGGDEVKYVFIRNYVHSEVLLQKAKEKGIDRDPYVLWLIDDFFRETIVNAYVSKEMRENVKVDPGELEKHYQEHIRGFTYPNEATVYMIKVKTEEKAKEILRQLKKGETFVRLASIESESSRIKTKADDWGHVAGLGTFREVSEAIFPLKPGEYTKKPLKRFDDYYYLFQMVEYHPAEDRSFEKVKEEVDRAVRRMKGKEIKRKLLESTLKEKGAEIYLLPYNKDEIAGSSK